MGCARRTSGSEACGVGRAIGMARRTSTGDPDGFTTVVTVSVGTGAGLGAFASSSPGCTGIAFKTGFVGSGISSDVAAFSASGDGEGAGFG